MKLCHQNPSKKLVLVQSGVKYELPKNIRFYYHSH
jgi:hypothetical protein